MRRGDRVLYGQRVDGVVRVTDVPLAAGGRAYLVERGLEEEGANANAVLQALIADSLQQAFVVDEVPMATIRFEVSGAPVRSGADVRAAEWIPAIGCAGREAGDRGTRITASSGTCPEGTRCQIVRRRRCGWRSGRRSWPMAGRRGSAGGSRVVVRLARGVPGSLVGVP